ncbi:MAG: DUF4199 domain-containing protein [Bacteroidota bacterium]
MEEKVKAPFWKPALTYGAIVGFVSILFGVILYIMNLSTKGWASWGSILVSLAVLIYCLVAYRKEYLGGFASYGQIVLMAVMIGVVSSVIATIYTYILYGVIDPDLADKLRLVAEEKMINNPRLPESMHEEMIERLEKNFELKRMLIMGMILGPVLSAIVGLIAGAFIKREENPANAAV